MNESIDNDGIKRTLRVTPTINSITYKNMEGYLDSGNYNKFLRELHSVYIKVFELYINGQSEKKRTYAGKLEDLSLISISIRTKTSLEGGK